MANSIRYDNSGYNGSGHSLFEPSLLDYLNIILRGKWGCSDYHSNYYTHISSGTNYLHFFKIYGFHFTKSLSYTSELILDFACPEVAKREQSQQ